MTTRTTKTAKPSTRPRRPSTARGAVSAPFAGTVGIAGQLDALLAAHLAGVLSKAEYQTKRKPLVERLHASAAADVDRMATLGPLGVTIGTTVVVTGEPIETAWGNQVRADLLALNAGKAELTGATFTGALNGTSLALSAGLTVGTTLGVTGAATFSSTGAFTGAVTVGAASSANHAYRKTQVDALLADYLPLTGGVVTGTLEVNGGGSFIIRRTGDVPFMDLTSIAGTLLARIAASATALRLEAQNELAFYAAAGEKMRLINAALLLGKTASNLDNDGVEIFATGSSALGSMRSTISSSSIQNVYARHMLSADANAVPFGLFTRTSSATTIGSITQVNTTGVAYNTTSERALKVDKGPIRDALKRLRARAPRMATFKGAAKSSPAEMVWYADDWMDAPGVTVGRPGAKITKAQAAAGLGKVGAPDPMQMDYGRTTPLIAAALLEIADRLDKAGL